MKRLIGAGLALAMVVIAGIAATTSVMAKTGGDGCHQPKTDAAGVTVDLKQNCFLPTVLRVAPGAEVRFESFDKQYHTVTGAGSNQAGGWGSYDELTHGSVVTQVFDEPGVYPYFCMLHPGMVGAIVVGDGVTDASVTTARNAGEPERQATVSAAEDRGAAATTVVAASAAGAAIALIVAVAVGGVVMSRRKQPE